MVDFPENWNLQAEPIVSHPAVHENRNKEIFMKQNFTGFNDSVLEDFQL